MAQKLLFFLLHSLVSNTIIATPVETPPAPQRTHTIQGVIFNDIHGNGIQDADDNGLFEWQLTLIGKETIMKTTAEDGSFTFDALPNGNYLLCETLQTGWVQTTPHRLPLCPNGSVGHHITLQNETEAVIHKTFGNFKNFSITGISFNDIHHDGKYKNDTTDPALSGWEVRLSLLKSSTLPQCESGDASFPAVIINSSCVVVTNSDGAYSFINLGPGTYIVEGVKQRGWTLTYPNIKYNTGEIPPTTYAVEGVSGENKEKRSFGAFRSGK